MAYMWRYIGNRSLKRDDTGEVRTFKSVAGTIWWVREDLSYIQYPDEDIEATSVALLRKNDVMIAKNPNLQSTFTVPTNLGFTLGARFIGCSGYEYSVPLNVFESSDLAYSALWRYDSASKSIIIEKGLSYAGSSPVTIYANHDSSNMYVKYYNESDSAFYTYNVDYDSQTRSGTYYNYAVIPPEYDFINGDIDDILRLYSVFFTYGDGGDYAKEITSFFNLVVYNESGSYETICRTPSLSLSVSELKNGVCTVTYKSYEDDSTLPVPMIKEGYRFAGLSKKQNSFSADYPIGSTTNITWKDATEVVLYPVWIPENTLYSPTFDRGTIQVMLYKNTAEHNRLNKTAHLEKVGDLYGSLREETSVTNPVLTVTYTGYPEFNYVYIYIFKRYYYVDDIVSVRNNVWEIHLSVDVLMTYNEAIRQCTAYIDRNENSYNTSIVDNRLPLEQEVSVSYSFKNNGTTSGTPFITTQGQFVLQGLLVSPITAAEAQSMSDGDSPVVNESEEGSVNDGELAE